MLLLRKMALLATIEFYLMAHGERSLIAHIICPLWKGKHRV